MSPTGSEPRAPFRISRGRGIALVEVLTAVVVLTVGIVGMIAVAGRALHAVHTAGERLQAMGRLEEEVVQLRSQARKEAGLNPETREGSWPSPKGVAWKAESTLSDAAPDLLAVTLRAEWVRSGRPLSVSISTMVPAKKQEPE